MPQADWLKYGVVFAAIYAAVALGILTWRTVKADRKPSFAPPKGSEAAGIRYAFTRGMMPNEKESVRKHLPTVFGGALYHLGIFASIVFVTLTLVRAELTPLALWTVRACAFAGLVSGAALLVKRVTLRKMRIISTPDDYVSNALVNMFLLFGLIASLSSDWIPVLFATTILLLVYMPLGKIRHCVFYFYTRVQFGRLFGRRGVLPHPVREKR